MTQASTLLFFLFFSIELIALQQSAGPTRKNAQSPSLARLFSFIAPLRALKTGLVELVGFYTRVTQKQHCVIFATRNRGKAQPVRACAAGEVRAIIG